MSQRVKRPNRIENDEPSPSKRRKGRPPAKAPPTYVEDYDTSGINSSKSAWQARPLTDLKISSIYNRSAPEAPAELFRKDLISAMKLPDSEPLANDEYWVITDPWKQEWERGVQVPVNPDSLPESTVSPKLFETYYTGRQDFKLPKNKFIRMAKDDNFSSEQHYLSETPGLAETACAYDLDQCDDEWLKIINNERIMSGMSLIQAEQFERVIEELEVRCWEKIQSIMKNEEGLGIEYDENVICDVCRSPDSEEANEMVFCDKCNICVHQACYGITTIPAGQWLCRTCNMELTPDCVLCPNRGGAMKSTRTGQKWAHVSCALWIPEVSIGSVDRMEPITKISSIPTSRWALICVLCRERVGACIQCSVKTCKTAYHVTCAFQHGLEMRAIIEDENAEDGVKLRSYCLKHSLNKNKKDKSNNGSGVGPGFGSNGGNGGGSVGGISGGSDDDDNKRKKIRKDLTTEERNLARVKRLQEVEREFHKHVNIKDISSHVLDVDDDAIQSVYNYWLVKRKSGNNRPLLPPKTEDVDIITHKQEQADVERMKIVHLRQDLERVRNLCYMVSRREKFKRNFIKMREQIFHKQIAFTETRIVNVGDEVIDAVFHANHVPSIYDQLYSIDDAPIKYIENVDNYLRIIDNKEQVSSPCETDLNGLNKNKKLIQNISYNRVFLNGVGGSNMFDSSLSSESDNEIIKKKLSMKTMKNVVRKSSTTIDRRQRKLKRIKKSNKSSTEEEGVNIHHNVVIGKQRIPKNLLLRQMEREIKDKTSGSESDDLVPIRNSSGQHIVRSHTKKISTAIYSDSDDNSTDKEKTDNKITAFEQHFRTKGAMKEFNLQSLKFTKNSQNDVEIKTVAGTSSSSINVSKQVRKEKSGLDKDKKLNKEKNEKEMQEQNTKIDRLHKEKVDTEKIKNRSIKSIRDMLVPTSKTDKSPLSKQVEKLNRDKSQKLEIGKIHENPNEKENIEKERDDVKFSKDKEKASKTNIQVVPQRQAAKKASEIMMRTTVPLNMKKDIKELKDEERDRKDPMKEKDIQKDKDTKDISKDVIRISKGKCSKLQPSAYPQQPQPQVNQNQPHQSSQKLTKDKDYKDRKMSDSIDVTILNKEKPKDSKISYVPQRQAAKKAAEHIKSGLGKPIVDTIGSGLTEENKTKLQPTVATTIKAKKEDRKSNMSYISSSSSSGSSTNSSSGSSSSSSSDSEDAEDNKSGSASSDNKPKNVKSDGAKDLPFLNKGRNSSASVASDDSSNSDSETSSSSSDDDSEPLSKQSNIERAIKNDRKSTIQKTNNISKKISVERERKQTINNEETSTMLSVKKSETYKSTTPTTTTTTTTTTRTTTATTTAPSKTKSADITSKNTNIESVTAVRSMGRTTKRPSVSCDSGHDTDLRQKNIAKNVKLSQPEFTEKQTTITNTETNVLSKPNRKATETTERKGRQQIEKQSPKHNTQNNPSEFESYVKDEKYNSIEITEGNKSCEFPSPKWETNEKLKPNNVKESINTLEREINERKAELSFNTKTRSSKNSGSLDKLLSKREMQADLHKSPIKENHDPNSKSPKQMNLSYCEMSSIKDIGDNIKVSNYTDDKKQFEVIDITDVDEITKLPNALPNKNELNVSMSDCYKEILKYPNDIDDKLNIFSLGYTNPEQQAVSNAASTDKRTVRSIFSPPSSSTYPLIENESGSMITNKDLIFTYNDEFLCNNDAFTISSNTPTITPTAPFTFPNDNLFNKDFKEDSAKETMNLVGKLRQNISKKSINNNNTNDSIKSLLNDNNDATIIEIDTSPEESIDKSDIQGDNNIINKDNLILSRNNIEFDENQVNNEDAKSDFSLESAKISNAIVPPKTATLSSSTTATTITPTDEKWLPMSIEINSDQLNETDQKQYQQIKDLIKPHLETHDFFNQLQCQSNITNHIQSDINPLMMDPQLHVIESFSSNRQLSNIVDSDENEHSPRRRHVNKWSEDEMIQTRRSFSTSPSSVSEYNDDYQHEQQQQIEVEQQKQQKEVEQQHQGEVEQQQQDVKQQQQLQKVEQQQQELEQHQQQQREVEQQQKEDDEHQRQQQDEQQQQIQLEDEQRIQLQLQLQQQQEREKQQQEQQEKQQQEEQQQEQRQQEQQQREQQQQEQEQQQQQLRLQEQHQQLLQKQQQLLQEQQILQAQQLLQEQLLLQEQQQLQLQEQQQQEDQQQRQRQIEQEQQDRQLLQEQQQKLLQQQLRQQQEEHEKQQLRQQQEEHEKQQLRQQQEEHEKQQLRQQQEEHEKQQLRQQQEEHEKQQLQQEHQKQQLQQEHEKQQLQQEHEKQQQEQKDQQQKLQKEQQQDEQKHQQQKQQHQQQQLLLLLQQQQQQERQYHHLQQPLQQQQIQQQKEPHQLQAHQQQLEQQQHHENEHERQQQIKKQQQQQEQHHHHHQQLLHQHQQQLQHQHQLQQLQQQEEQLQQLEEQKQRQRQKEEEQLRRKEKQKEEQQRQKEKQKEQEQQQKLLLQQQEDAKQQQRQKEEEQQQQQLQKEELQQRQKEHQQQYQQQQQHLQQQQHHQLQHQHQQLAQKKDSQATITQFNHDNIPLSLEPKSNLPHLINSNINESILNTLNSSLSPYLLAQQQQKQQLEHQHPLNMNQFNYTTNHVPQYSRTGPISLYQTIFPTVINSDFANNQQQLNSILQLQNHLNTPSLSSLMSIANNNPITYSSNQCGAAFTSSSHNMAITTAIAAPSPPQTLTPSIISHHQPLLASSQTIISPGPILSPLSQLPSHHLPSVLNLPHEQLPHFMYDKQQQIQKQLNTSDQITSSRDQENDLMANNTQSLKITNIDKLTKKSPTSKKSRVVSQPNMQYQLTSNSPHDKSPRQPSELILKSQQSPNVLNDHQIATTSNKRPDANNKQSRSRNARTSNMAPRGNRSRGGRGRGRFMNTTIPSLGEIDSLMGGGTILSGTVYDFDEDFGGDNVQDLKAMRDRRRSIEGRLESVRSTKDTSQSPTVTSPNNYHSINNNNNLTLIQIYI